MRTPHPVRVLPSLALVLALTGCGAAGTSPGPAGGDVAGPGTSVATTADPGDRTTTDDAATTREETAAATTVSVDEAASTPSASAPAGVPVELGIDGLGTWPLRRLGVDADGFINPPPGTVQWYDASPRPGDPGIAVIAGHVTWAGRPDAFAGLADVAVGAGITVRDAAGTVRRYRVVEVRELDKDAAMHDPDLWGTSSTSRLAVVTCDDRSAVEAGGHYADNLVVEAELVPDGSSSRR